MSSNIPLMNPTEDKIEYKDMAQNKVPSLDKSGSASKSETEHTEKLDTKNIYFPLASSDDRKFQDKNQKTSRSKKINQHMIIKVIQVFLHHIT